MKFNKILFLTFLVSFLLLSQFIIFEVDREAWFDSSFSLETAYILNTEGFSSIDFRSFDVHPPLYYYVLASWQKINPGMSEYHWAQELSVLIASMFLVLAFIGLTKLFPQYGVYGIIPLVFGTTYLHFATEPRMYIFVFALSALLFTSIMYRLKGLWMWFATVAVLLLPNFHYLAGMILPVMLLIHLVYNKDDPNKKLHFWLLVLAWVAGILVALNWAIPQRMRTAGTWFQPPTISSWMSAAFYSIFMGDVFASEITWFARIYFTLFQVLVWTIIFAFAFYIWKRRKQVISLSKSSSTLLIMMCTAVLPLLALAFLSIGKQLTGGGAFWHLYHHRFFLGLTWMFAAGLAVMVASFAGNWLKKSGKVLLGGVVVFVFATMLLGYANGVHHELQQTVAQTPCEPAWIGHESPFSSIPYAVYERELGGCGWNHFVSTQMTEKMSHSAGFDAIPNQTIYWNRELPVHGFYHVRSTGELFNLTGRSYSQVYVGDGIALLWVDPINNIEVLFK